LIHDNGHIPRCPKTIRHLRPNALRNPGMHAASPAARAATDEGHRAETAHPANRGTARPACQISSDSSGWAARNLPTRGARTRRRGRWRFPRRRRGGGFAGARAGGGFAGGGSFNRAGVGGGSFNRAAVGGGNFNRGNFSGNTANFNRNINVSGGGYRGGYYGGVGWGGVAAGVAAGAVVGAAATSAYAYPSYAYPSSSCPYLTYPNCGLY
jgi:hypothetical protein